MSFSQKSISTKSKSLERPPTRRHPFDMPTEAKIRSMSAIVTSRKYVNSPIFLSSVENCENSNKEKHIYIEKFLKQLSRFKKTLKETTKNTKYRKFILDIVNEIIKKRIIVVEKIYIIFMKHIEINAMFLDMEKMLIEMKKFCINFKIPFDENLFQLSNNKKQLCKKSRSTEEISITAKSSLSRLTEYTEPNSLENEDSTRIIDGSPIPSFRSLEVLPGFESLELESPKNVTLKKDVGTQKDLPKVLQKPTIKIHLKNSHIKQDDYVLLECPVYIPKCIFEKSKSGKKHKTMVDNIRIDASVAKIGVKRK